MRQPPLNALRAFEAAARHASFKRAGEELNVSPGAISRFVKLVEQDMEVALFERLPSGLRLTAKGRALAPHLTQAFRDLEGAVRQVARSAEEIRIVLPETIALRLLIAKVMQYNRQGLGSPIRYDAEFKEWENIFSGQFDLGVCCYMALEHRPPGMEFRLLQREALTPLCAPSLLGAAGPLLTPEDLVRFDLLHSYVDKSDWKKWLAAAGVRSVDPEGGSTFLSMELAVKAAIHGMGVVIADLMLFADEVRSGALVAPFDFVLKENTGYFLFGHPDRLAEPHIAAFSDWLLEEVGAAQQAAE
ncbi:MAG TPA: LysR substrate-binding domain-containing protein [Thermohalobaculum sp.]|nr:LysR substrate-binding domain-containing protein [Thermohalobaculum sp.]